MSAVNWFAASAQNGYPALMLQVQNLTFRIGARVLFDGASLTIPPGHRAGLVGRNGIGKSTLFRLALGEISPESGDISLPRRARIGTVAQEAPGGGQSLLETVLQGDTERTLLLAEAETCSDHHRIAEIQTRLADIAAHSAPARAASILAGLGFSDAQIAGPCAALSGGWRMRVALAAALFGQPDVLLLDEPTNYLDLEGVIWLKSFLRNYPHTIVLISHDRDLLNDVATCIVHVDQGKLALYQGNYDSFDRQRREKQALNVKLRKKQEEQRAHMQAYVDRFRYKASKARQAQSRLKALARLEPVVEMADDRVMPFRFPVPAHKLSPPLISLNRVSVGYEPGRPVLRNLTLRIDPDDRIALVGANGNGKSTFAKLLDRRLTPQAGEMVCAPKLVVGYFAQHQMDELADERTPYEYATQLMPDRSAAERRARLGAAGFGAHLADSRCATLSGGEKARLLFLLATFHAPHVLILDEPTNHLDMDSREALIHAINDYPGAVILVAHDRHIVETCADKLWLVADGTLAAFDGDLGDYAALVLSQRRKAPAEKAPPMVQSTPAPAPARRAKQLHRKVSDLDMRMQKTQEKLTVLDQALADHKIYSEAPQKAADFARLRNRLAEQLARDEELWLALQEELANA